MLQKSVFAIFGILENYIILWKSELKQAYILRLENLKE
jgi:hypothetical protein